MPIILQSVAVCTGNRPIVKHIPNIHKKLIYHVALERCIRAIKSGMVSEVLKRAKE